MTERILNVAHLGVVDYAAALELQHAMVAARQADRIGDTMLLLEHPHVFTLGRGADERFLLNARTSSIPIYRVSRGGQVTYHGPGQLVAYMLFDLRRARLGVREMVRRIEGAVITWLATFDIAAFGRISAPGVYVARDGAEAKIAALGLRVRNGCTYHGVAVNVDMNLAPFADIDPCGYAGLAVTQLADFGVRSTVADAGRTLAPLLAAAMGTRG